MPRVLCKLPNASSSINGVSFVSHADGGMVSADLSDEQAAAFAEIPGYSIVGAPAVVTGSAGSAPAGGQQPDPDAEELARLRARGVELAIPNAAQMGIKRLRELVPAAEKAAADKAAGTGEQPQA